MSCYRPVKGYINLKGKFQRQNNGAKLLDATMPCGHCDGCRRRKRDDWAIRCTHEAKLYRHNTFITLTYDPENLPVNGSLVPHHMDRFLDNLRKRLNRKPFRFFACGEYGDNFHRPHYHILLFDYWPEDARQAIGTDYFSSKFLTDKWKKGHVSIGQVTYASAKYAAKYTLKEPIGYKKAMHQEQRYDHLHGLLVDVDPQFVKFSPGLGKKWVEKYWTDYYPNDFIVMRNQNGTTQHATPRFYDDWLRQHHPEIYAQVKIARHENQREELGETRLAQIELAKRRNASIISKGKL